MFTGDDDEMRFINDSTNDAFPTSFYISSAFSIDCISHRGIEVLTSTWDIKMNETNIDVNEDTNHEEHIAKWIWRISAPVLFVLGVFGNFQIMYVMYRLKFWKRITFIFLFILAISDTVVLCSGLSREWIEALLSYDIRNASNIGCKFHVFIIYFSMHFSSWTLVCITFERFLKTRDPFSDNCLRASKNVKIAYYLSIVVCIGIDVPLLVTNGLVLTEKGQICNNTSNEFYIYEDKYFVFIDLIWLSLLPFTLILAMNVVIGRTIITSFQRNIDIITDTKNRTRRRQINRTLSVMLFVTSMYFIAATLPISILFIVDSFVSSKTELPKACLYVLQFSNYALNFYIYMKFKPSFRRHLNLACLRKKRKPEQGRMTQTQMFTNCNHTYHSQSDVENEHP